MPRPRETLLQFTGLADFLHFLDWGCGLADSTERLATWHAPWAEGCATTEPGMSI